MEVGKQRKIEGGNFKLDGKLFKGKRNEKSGKGQEIGMEKCRQRGAAGIGTGTSTFSNIFINDMQDNINSYTSLFADDANC